MAGLTFGFGISRNLLLQAIMECVNSWPELQRRIFISVHYGGKPESEVAAILGLSRKEVEQALQDCERQLHQALKPFREAESPEAPYEPRRESVRAPACCFH
jgi:DNA-directed RNA polymerase specialized sigma24 family protein